MLPLYLWVCGVLSTHHQYTLESCLWSSDNNMDGMFHWTWRYQKSCYVSNNLVLEQNVFTEVKMRVFLILLFWASSSMAAVPVPVILIMILFYKQNDKSRLSLTPTFILMIIEMFFSSKMRNQGDPRHRHGFRCRWCRSPLCSACAAGWGNLFLEVEQMSKIDFENEIIGMEMMAALIVVEGSWRGWADRCGP